MRNAKEINIGYAFASLRKASIGIEISELVSIYCWLEGPMIKIFFHLCQQPKEESAEEILCIRTGVMADYDIDYVDVFWGLEAPQETKNMVKWIMVDNGG